LKWCRKERRRVFKPHPTTLKILEDSATPLPGEGRGDFDIQYIDGVRLKFA
jgi:hypothetical protein